MRRGIWRRPSAALVVSLVALFVALGGTSYAALRLPRNSVGTNQLRNGAVTGRTIRNGAVSAIKINPSGLTVPQASQASDASLFGGHAPSFFLPAGGTAANSNLLGGFSADHFLPAGGTAANSNLLGGLSADHFLPAGGTAANSNLLGGFSADHFLAANDTAADSLKLGGYPASAFYRLRTEPLPNSRTTVEAVAGQSSTTIGSDGLPVISYQDNDTSTLKVLHCGNLDCISGNTTSTIDTDEAGAWSSIAIGADGLPIVSYQTSANSVLHLAFAHCGNLTCSSGNSVTIVDNSSPNTGVFTSITIGTDGLPLVSYRDASGDSLKVVHCGNATCTSGNSITTVDNTPGAGVWTSITTGADGLPIISYFDEDTSAGHSTMRVAHCGNEACSSGNTLTTVDSNVNFSYELDAPVSLTIGADGLPLLAYQASVGNGGSSNVINVLHCGSLACSAGNTITPIDNTGTLGGGDIVVTIGSDGLPLITYAAGGNPAANLDVIHCGDGACTSGDAVTTIVGDGQASGGSWQTGMTIGADGLPLIAYGAHNGSLHTIHCANTFCVPYFRRR